MGMKFTMSLDIGGSAGKCLVYDHESKRSFVSSVSWSSRAAREYGSLAYDLDLDAIWAALGRLSRDALATAGAKPEDVAAVAVTSMRHTTVAVDAAGNTVFATPNLDARALAEAAAIADDHGDEFYGISGHWPCPIMSAARLVWLRERLPEEYARVSAVMTASDWAGWRLSGVMAAERTQAAETMCLDLATRSWSSRVIGALGFPDTFFPPLVDAGATLGRLGTEGAELLGLGEGTAVVAAGADTQCGLVGMLALSPGEAGIVAGSTTPVMLISDKPVIDPAAKTWTGLHSIPGRYVLESNAGSMGTALGLVAGAMYADAPSPIAALLAEASSLSPGESSAVSTVGAQVFNASAIGVPVDSVTFSSMALRGGKPGRAELARAVVDGMAFGIRANIAQLRSVFGREEGAVRAGGGMTRSVSWPEIIAAALGKGLSVGAIPDVTALGAAACAAVGAGLYRSLDEAAAAMVATRPVAPPSSETASAYDELFEAWEAIRSSRADVDAQTTGAILQRLDGRPVEAAPRGDAAFRPRILVTADAGDAAIAMLRELGDVTYASYLEEGRILSGGELREVAAGYDILVTEMDVVDAESLAGLPGLRLVVVCRGNPVNIDVPACSAAGVPVINTPGRNSDAVAELALCYMLMLSRRLPEASAFLREPGGEAGDMGRMTQAFTGLRGDELWGKTIGLVGSGAVGRKVVERLLPFGAKVVVYDPFVSEGAIALLGAKKVGLADLLAASDIVSLHAAVTDDTKGLIGAEEFAAMKDGSFLVNTARAALVDSGALLEALKTGKLKGAALDVFDEEPPASDDPLLLQPGVIATPHIGGNTNQLGVHQGGMIVDELKRLLVGSKPRYALNPAALEGFSWTGERAVDAAALSERAKGPGPGMRDLDVKGGASEPASAVGAASAPNTTTGSEPQAMVGSAPGIGDQSPVAAKSLKEKSGLFGAIRRMLGGGSTVATTGGTDMEDSNQTTGARQASSPSAETVLARFMENLRGDAKIIEFSKGKHIAYSFQIKELSSIFYFDFQDGVVKASFGDCPDAVDVKLKMSLESLVGIIAGKANATKLAMGGKLSFSGDTAKALTLSRLVMSEVYAKTCGELGISGEISSFSGGQTGAAPSAGSAPQASARGAAAIDAGGTASVSAAAPIAQAAVQASPKTGDVRDEMLQILNELYALGLVTATGGNVSARVEGKPDEVWITPAGIFKGDLRADMMVRVDLDGNLVGDAEYGASSERMVHCAVYRQRPDVGSVIHTHAPMATLMGITGTKFAPISTEAAYFGDVPVVPFAMPGTAELGEKTAAAIGEKGIAAIMQNHGLVVCGSTVRKAADMTEVLEQSAEKLLYCRLLGTEPAVLPESALKSLAEMGSMMA